MEGLIVDDVDQEEDVWGNQISGRNCILFLIDVRKEMFSSNDETSYFKQSMLCCRDAMLDIAKKQRGDLVAVLLFGTNISEGKYAPDNVALLQDLAVPSVPMIKHFQEMIDNDFKQLRKKYGDIKEVDLTRAINYCQIVIHMNKRKLYLRNLVMMTYDDNPCGDSEIAAFRARKQATELYLHQIEFEVVSFGEQFDSNKLFKELVLTSKGELLRDWEEKDPIIKIQDVQGQKIDMITQKFTRRISFLQIGKEPSKLCLQISLYKLYTEPRKFLTTIKHSNPTENKESMTIDDDDDDIFLQEDVMAKIEQEEKLAISNATKNLITTGQKDSDNAKTQHGSEREEVRREDNELRPLIGERFIDITKTELKKRIGINVMKMTPGFQLIGFVLTVDVPLYLNSGEPYFVVPYGHDKNNRIAFSHLLHKCRERGVSMFGWFCLTKSASPALTFLHPENKSTEGKGHPEGFLLVRVPFADDLFEIDESECVIKYKPNNEQLDAAKKIVSKLTLPYVVDSFKDAEYNARIAMIEALAMEYTEEAETEDTTDVDLDEVSAVLGDLSVKFTGDQDESYPASNRALKRSAPREERGSVKHRREMDIIKMIEAGQAKNLTVAELRDVLRAEGIKSLSALNKPRLVDIATRRFCSNSQ